jgi:hypothetical protein
LPYFFGRGRVQGDERARYARTENDLLDFDAG